MRILICSDLHREMPKKVDLPDPPSDDLYDVVVAAGDIAYGLQGLKWLERRFPNHPVIFVEGNHEFYTRPYDVTRRELDSYKGPINVLNRQRGIRKKIAGITFLGVPLWSSLTLEGYPPLMDFQVERGITDFRWGRTAVDHRFDHAEDVRVLDTKLRNIHLDDGSNSKTVVVTHFVPSQYCIANHWKGNAFNPYFTNDMDWMINKYKPPLWIFGHTHDRHDVKHPSGTRLVSNPAGYHSENPDKFHWKIVSV